MMRYVVNIDCDESLYDWISGITIVLEHAPTTMEK